MKINEQGPHVKKLQEALQSRGYELPKYGADGWLGHETIRAALSLAIDNGWRDEDIEHMATAMDGVPDDLVAAILNKPSGLPQMFVDRRDTHPIKNAYSTPRKLTDVTAIVLHQTACHMGTRVARWDSLPAHFGVLTDGVVVLVNRLETVCWHANYFNRFSVGIEIDGNFAGVYGSTKTVWAGGGRESHLTQSQVAGAKEACRWICEQVSAAGGRVKDILAHRQTSDSRRGDPGEEIWKAVGIWAQDELGLTNDVGYTKGSGAPIPADWDSRSAHKY